MSDDADELREQSTGMNGPSAPPRTGSSYTVFVDRPEGARDRKTGNGTDQARLIMSSAGFVAGFVPPDYLIDGILQRRFCYSFTAKTGAGKTAILLLIAACVGAGGKALGDRTVERGRVLVLAGENADDVRMRWIAMAQQMDFDVNNVEVYFIPGRFKVSQMKARIRGEIDAIGEFALIIIDTSAAYFEGDDENSNTQQMTHACTLRSLTEMPGGPCVLIACHPTKNATDDNLIPRRGGAFLGEVDGNLTGKRDGLTVEVHWAGKFRGPDFAPMSFQLRTVTHQNVKDTKGRPPPVVVASSISEFAREEMDTAARYREDELLKAVAQNPKATQRELAVTLGWEMRDGRPYQTLVHRSLASLKEAKVISIERDGVTLTKAGRRALRDEDVPDHGNA